MPSANFDKEMLNAAAAGNVDAVRQAVQKGAEPRALDGDRRTGAHLAVLSDMYGNNEKARDAVSFFLNHGVDINDKDRHGATILHMAAQIESYGGEGRVRDYITFGADIEATDNQARRPIHWAAIKGYGAAVIKLLAASGAKVNVADDNGVTPMHLAAARGDEGIIKAFIDLNADLNAITKNGKAVWDYAADAGKDYQAQSLKSAAAKQKRDWEQQAEQRRLTELKKAQDVKHDEAAVKDPWILLAPDRVAFSTVEKPLGYKLTEIFNFTARTYTQIVHNLATKGEAVVLKTFDEFSDKTPIEKAHAALERLGGTAGSELVGGPVLEKPKRNFKLQAPHN